MTLIYKDGNYSIGIDFYQTPATVELYTNDELLTKIDINGEYIEGDMRTADILSQWIEDNKTDIEDIVWEWECGNDDFNLVENKIIL